MSISTDEVIAQVSVKMPTVSQQRGWEGANTHDRKGVTCAVAWGVGNSELQTSWEFTVRD